MRIGDFEIMPVHDGTLVVPATMMFPTTSAEDWIPHKQFLNDGGMLEMGVGGFLVRGNGTVALVDVGFGPIEGYPELGGKLLDSLAALGHEPAEVTDVLFSHLHFDHIGWSSREGRNVFPNATFRCHAADWDYFMTKNTHQGPMTEGLGISPYAESWLGPVRDRFEIWDADRTVLPGIDARHAPGHTPGSTILVVSSKDERAILLGDAVHCPAELMESEWEMVGDVDRELARRTREALAREFEGTQIPLAAPHFPGMQFGRLLRAQGRLGWTTV